MSVLFPLNVMGHRLAGLPAKRRGLGAGPMLESVTVPRNFGILASLDLKHFDGVTEHECPHPARFCDLRSVRCV